MPACIVNHILGGGGLTSRLFREVREKRGLAYSVREQLVWLDHSAMFLGTSGTCADRAGETVEEIEKQVRQIAAEGPTQQELDDAKSYLKGSQLVALNTSSKLARTLLQHQLDKLPIDYLENQNAVVDAVTLEDAKESSAAAVGRGSAHNYRRPRPKGRSAGGHCAVQDYTPAGRRSARHRPDDAAQFIF